MKNTVIIATMLAILPVFATAQGSEIRTIDAYVKSVEAHTSKRKNPKVIFADTSDYTEESKPAWRKFASEKALEAHRDKSEAYTIAYNWLRGGKLIASNFTLFSPSGDWTKYVFSYYREDGSLARADVDYRTFQGDVIVLQKLYFDRSGKQIKKTTAYRDLQTNKPKKVTNGSFNPGALNEVDHYKTVAKLPYAHLLKK